jgi:hypothetical protein
MRDDTLFAIRRIELCRTFCDGRPVMVSEFTVKVGKYRAKFPSFELAPDKRAAKFDQRPDVAIFCRARLVTFRPLSSQ